MTIKVGLFSAFFYLEETANAGVKLERSRNPFERPTFFAMTENDTSSVAFALELCGGPLKS